VRVEVSSDGSICRLYLPAVDQLALLDFGTGARILLLVDLLQAGWVWGNGCACLDCFVRLNSGYEPKAYKLKFDSFTTMF
jgi:hypothetical protein